MQTVHEPTLPFDEENDSQYLRDRLEVVENLIDKLMDDKHKVGQEYKDEMTNCKGEEVNSKWPGNRLAHTQDLIDKLMDVRRYIRKTLKEREAMRSEITGVTRRD
ncbi:hypothetical protein VNI00_006290 [Paramarasmius palmivorus]|uniref:Uncharacterized protein n=1 Tax=Paramarasmius palmivorus TaxID=297713 RepID=A0AAW0DB31_9AGAR